LANGEGLKWKNLAKKYFAGGKILKINDGIHFGKPMRCLKFFKKTGCICANFKPETTNFAAPTP
jgi:hypothetical protein